MNLEQELTAQYVSAGADRRSLDDRRVARAAFVRDTIRTIYHADKRFGVDPIDLDSLAELVDAAEEHLLFISRAVGQVPAEPSPGSRGENA